MVSTVLLAVSGILIGAGIALLIRDLLGGRRASFLKLPVGLDRLLTRGRDAAAEAEIEVSPIRRIIDRGQSTPPSSYPDPVVPPAAPMSAAGGFHDEAASALAWATCERPLELALRAINGAFATAGARLAPDDGPRWVADRGVHELGVAVLSDDAARAVLALARHPGGLTVAATAPAEIVASIAAEHLPAHAVTVPSLAEAIARCAWACIAASARTR